MNEIDEKLEAILMHKLPFEWGKATDLGKVREKNEDAFIIDPEIGLFLVSDGMGGHRGGSLAANIVIEDLPVMIENRLNGLRSSNPRSVRAIFKGAIVEQSKQLWMEGVSESGYKNMGATIVMAMIKQRRAYIANLGDSRLYRFRNNRLTQLSRDHSVISELLDKGHIQPHEAEDHEAQGQLTNYAGMPEKPSPYVYSFALKPRDRLLLCTDGLTDMVTDKTIAKVLRIQHDPQSACEILIELANAAGGHDNTTAVVIDYRTSP